MKGQSGEWHHLGEIDSQETGGADAPRVSDGTDYDAKRPNTHHNMV